MTTSRNPSACANWPRGSAAPRRGRAGEAPQATTYQGAHLTADFDAVSVQVDGVGVKLTRREFELLIRRQPQPRAVARSPARTGLGLTASSRSTVGGRLAGPFQAPSWAPPAGTGDRIGLGYRFVE